MNSINTPLVASLLVNYFGSQTKTAKALNIEQPTVNGWLANKHGISAKTALRIERVTKGKFIAANLCSDLAESDGYLR